MTDLDPSTIEALTATVSRSQAPALKILLYKHMTQRASLGVDIPVSISPVVPTFTVQHYLLITILSLQSRGFRTFAFDFHLPYFVLRESNNRFKDRRKRIDGTPLRQSWDFPFLSRFMGTSTSTSAPRPLTLYEAQTSVAVTGIDHWVWTAYGFVDTYFDSEESVDKYDRLSQNAWSRELGRLDPLMGEPIDSGKFSTPREYFLRVFEIRLLKVLREWRLIIDRVQDEVEQYVHNQSHLLFPLPSRRSWDCTQCFRITQTCYGRVLRFSLSQA